MDTIARQSEEALVKNGLAARQSELAAAVQTSTDWDDAVVKLDNRFDPAWARTNIGVSLQHDFGFDRIAILDSADRPIFAMNGADVIAPSSAALARAAAPLVELVRERERARGPFRYNSRSVKIISSPIQAVSVGVVAGAPSLLTVTLVQPDFGAATPAGMRAPIVIAARTIDAGFLGLLAERYRLNDARLSPASATTPDHFASVTIADVAGKPLLALQWRPHEPGTEFFNRTRLAGGVAVGCFAGVLLLFFLATRRAYASLIESRAELRQALSASETARAAKSEFLAAMSHEIRTPLNGVIGALHLLRDSTISADDRVLLDTAMASGEMVGALINDVLDYSKIEAGQMTLAPTPTDIAATIRAVADQFHVQCEHKGIDLTLDLATDLGWAAVDSLRLRQCLFNLIGNAVKFTTAGGIKVNAARHASSAGQRLVIAVTDTGVGIPDDAKAALFERFTQADGSTTRRFGGSGLGLTITKQLAELMDGGVTFISRLGVGSTFWLEIAAPPAQAVVTPEPIALDDRPLRDIAIMVVDDNATNRLIASKMLGRLGADVTAAQGGGEAIALARIRTFDLILMDIQMPGMDGLEATRRLRAETAVGADTPIIALTANAFEEQRQTYLAAGMNGVVSKPISPGQLLAEICRCAAGEAEAPVQAAVA